MGEGPIAYQDENGTWCYRLSAWGGCIRDLVAARRGVRAMPPSGEPDPWLREGHLHERDVVDQLLADGWDVQGQQDEVQLLIGSGKIVGHLDAGHVSNPHYRDHIMEVKALGKATFSDCESMGVEKWFEHHYTYSWQVAGGMWATGHPAVVIAKSRDSGKVLIGELTIPPRSLEDFHERMSFIDLWVDQDKFPACEKTGFCWKGPYRHIHFKEESTVRPIPIHETRSQAVEELATKLHDARKKKRAAEQLEEELKEELLLIAGEGVYFTERLKMTIRETESVRMDQKQVRKDHGDAYDIPTRYPVIRLDELE